MGGEKSPPAFFYLFFFLAFLALSPIATKATTMALRHKPLRYHTVTSHTIDDATDSQPRRTYLRQQTHFASEARAQSFYEAVQRLSKSCIDQLHKLMETLGYEGCLEVASPVYYEYFGYRRVADETDFDCYHPASSSATGHINYHCCFHFTLREVAIDLL